MIKGKKIIKVAAVQMVSKNGANEENLQKATVLVEEAAKNEAKLVLTPEFLPNGYLFTSEIWDTAETKEGATVAWLKETARRHNIFLGTSFLEADGLDFFNTFALADPGGQIAGWVRKETPAAFEAYFTKGEKGPHYIDTELGRIGVGICYENQLSYIPNLMHEHSVDLILQPHSAPTPMPVFFLNPRKNSLLFDHVLTTLAKNYALQHRVPVVMANKCGPWKTSLPGFPLMPDQVSSFPGLSTICDSDGTIRAQMRNEEGVIVRDVNLDPSRKPPSPPRCYGRKAMGVTWADGVWRLNAFLGRIYYAISSKRKEKAQTFFTNP